MLPRVIATFLLFSSVAAQSQSRDARAIPEYGKIGSGPDTVLIIPCMSCRWTAWADFMRANEARYTFFAVTPPGFGGTESPGLMAHDSVQRPWRRGRDGEIWSPPVFFSSHGWPRQFVAARY